MRQSLKKDNSPSITPLRIDDIDSVVSLSRKFFPPMEYSVYTQKKRTTDLYFKDGQLLPNVSPIVSRSTTGEVNGFLGVITKSFRYKDKTITISSCHHLMATDEARKQLIPLRLLQHFLAGPQNVSLADGSSDLTRHLWNRLGGESVSGESIYYKIPLRPFSIAANHFLKKYQNWASDSIRFLASGTDSIGKKMRIPFFFRDKTPTELAPLTAPLLEVLLEKIEVQYLLFPEYDLADIEQLFQLLKGETRYGKLHKYGLFDSNNQPIGWFIYYGQKGRICEVIQAVSIPGKETELFDSLAWHAFSMGGIALSGRLMPSQLQTQFTTKTISIPARMWTLIKSDDIELKYLIHSGKTFMTRLEGDLWVL